MKVLKWFMKSLIITLVILLIVNVIGSYININIPVNIYTIMTIFLLRVPGVLILIVFFLI